MTPKWMTGSAHGQLHSKPCRCPELFLRQVGVRVLAGPAGCIAAGVNTAAMAVVVNTVHDPDLLPAGRVQVVVYQDPNIVHGERRLVTATVQANCRGITAARSGTRSP